MSKKSVEEIMADARRLTRQVQTAGNKGEEAAAPSKSGESRWSMKRLVKDYIYDSGETEALPDAPAVDEAGDQYTDVPEFDVPEDVSGDLSRKPLDEIYAEANVPDSPCDINEFETILQSPEIANQPLNYKVMAVPFALKMKGVDITAPLSDAAARDAALDGYQLMLTRRAKQVRAETEARILEIQAELEQIFAQKQQEMDDLKSQAADAERQNMEFAPIRMAEERRMASLIEPFLGNEANPVTVGNTLTADEEVSNEQEAMLAQGKDYPVNVRAKK